MIRQVHQAARRKISDFIRLEEGRVSHRHALTAAALVTTSALAGVLLAPQPVFAGHNCGGCPPCGGPIIGEYCCWATSPFCYSGYDYSCDNDGEQCG